MRKKSARLESPAKPQSREPLQDRNWKEVAWRIIDAHTSKDYEIDFPAIVKELKAFPNHSEVLLGLIDAADEIMRQHSYGNIIKEPTFKMSDGYKIIAEWIKESPGILKDLMNLVTQSDVETRANAVFSFIVLAQEGIDISAAANSLHYALFDENIEIRECACMVFATLEPSKDRVFSLLNLLFDAEGSVKASAGATLLTWMNPECSGYEKRKMVKSTVVKQLRHRLPIPNAGLLPDEFYMDWLKRQVEEQKPDADN